MCEKYSWNNAASHSKKKITGVVQCVSAPCMDDSFDVNLI